MTWLRIAITPSKLPRRRNPLSDLEPLKDKVMTKKKLERRKVRMRLCMIT